MDTLDLDLLSTSQVAKLLNIAQRTVCLWAECDTLPGVKVGRQWRFRRDELLAWINTRNLSKKPQRVSFLPEHFRR
jgi:excisionase family DNA binding protein